MPYGRRMRLDGPEEGDMTLREFFIELLKDGNLKAYHEDRKRYIAEWGQGLAPADLELLETGSLADIEQRILEEQNSPRSVPMLVVFPPY
jgi:hypothetical protein